jgi:hypothetical protein
MRLLFLLIDTEFLDTLGLFFWENGYSIRSAVRLARWFVFPASNLPRGGLDGGIREIVISVLRLMSRGSCLVQHLPVDKVIFLLVGYIFVF